MGKKAVAPPQIFGGHAPQIWNRQSLSSHTSNHVWKFRGDRLSHLGDIAPQSATKKKKKEKNHSKT